ncbi:MAG: zinc ABC transporter substrate-binding protein [Cyanobacteria bacterium]|nr:zinc ABC transporter substrate-binding protein [Cyanobacteriota bacterium]MDW8199721.1 zinc ABC transporter substrate-binding protein [Cyanobacteriota bacterium SKYGB_h_bin112]
MMSVQQLNQRLEAYLGSLALAIAVALTGCNQPEPASTPSTVPASPAATVSTPTESKPRVVATHNVLCDLTRTIAAETIDLTCLVQPGMDPHVYQPTPSDRQAIDSAQLVLYGGYDLEPSIEALIKASKGSALKVAVSEQAVPKPLLGKAHDHGAHDHADKGHHDHHHHAEAETVPDPHVWHNAQNGIAMVKVIRDQLQKLAPRHADQYRQTSEQLIAQLTRLDQWIAEQIATIPADRRKLVTTHDALSYYGQAYGIQILGTLQGLSTAEQPTPTRLKQLVTEIKAAQVPTIFAERSTNDKVLGTLAREAKVTLSQQPINADGLGQAESATGTYIGMLATNTCTIVNGLGGACRPFTP